MNAKLLLTGVSIFGLLAATAHAEAVDYTSLESLFGEAVTTSATGKPQKASEAPVAMTIITAEQIHRAAAVDMPGILREYTDLDVWQWGRNSSDVSVRGYNQAPSPRLLVLVNGRQVYLDYYGYTDWNALPVQLSEIHQIEVVKGPNSALFGFNAVSGVINIITANPLYDTLNTAEVTVGTGAYRSVSGAASGQIGKIGGIRLSAGGDDSHAFKTTSGSIPVAPEKGPERRSVNLDSLFQVTDDLQVGFEASHVLNSQLTEAIPGGSLAQYRTVTSSAKGSFSDNTSIGVISGNAYHNVTDIGIPFAGSNLSIHSTSTVAQLQDLFRVGADHSFRLAAEYRYEDMNPFPLKGALISYSVYSPSAMWDWAVTPRLELTNAVRYDYLALARTGDFSQGLVLNNESWNNKTLGKISANSAAVYKLTPEDSLRLSFARGLQLPSLAFLGISIGNPVLLTGNPSLQPTIVTNYELGYSRDVPEWGSKVTGSVFYQTNEGLMGNVPGSPTAYSTYVNIGDSDAWGTELGLDGHSANGFRWGGSWRLEYLHDKLSVPDGVTYGVDYGQSTPHHLLTVRGGYSLGKWDFDLYGRYATAYSVLQSLSATGSSPYRVPSTVTLDARVGYNITDNIWVSLSGVGIQAPNYRSSSGQATERQGYLTVGAKF